MTGCDSGDSDPEALRALEESNQELNTKISDMKAVIHQAKQCRQTEEQLQGEIQKEKSENQTKETQLIVKIEENNVLVVDNGLVDTLTKREEELETRLRTMKDEYKGMKDAIQVEKQKASGSETPQPVNEPQVLDSNI